MCDMHQDGPKALWEQLEQCFHHWLESPGNDKQAVLEELCQQNPQLADDLQDMVKHFGDAQQFMEPPDAPVEIGGYRIIKEIGCGGMGMVYLAERTDVSFDQQVALKVMRSHTGLPSQLDKFINERKVLSMFNHQGIVRLLDGGTTEDGVVFFTMEYVEGLNLIEHATANQSSLMTRVALIADVCEAIQAAHQSLIVHRDLKPSNILVTPKGQVKILDFGLATLCRCRHSQVQSTTLRQCCGNSMKNRTS